MKPGTRRNAAGDTQMLHTDKGLKTHRSNEGMRHRRRAGRNHTKSGEAKLKTQT